MIIFDTCDEEMLRFMESTHAFLNTQENTWTSKEFIYKRMLFSTVKNNNKGICKNKVVTNMSYLA